MLKVPIKIPSKHILESHLLKSEITVCKNSIQLSQNTKQQTQSNLLQNNIIQSKIEQQIMLSPLLKLIQQFSTRQKPQLSHIPSLKEFMRTSHSNPTKTPHSFQKSNTKTNYYLETYGCQMNTSDSELIRGLLQHNYTETNEEEADIIMINTCAIRDSAEQKIFQRIHELKKNKTIAVLGCMAERLKTNLLTTGAHIVCGPDAYRELPRLIEIARLGEQAVEVQLSAEETYAQVNPIRKNPNSVKAFISIMRGCNNMCSFCIVPFVRGRERSRPIKSIMLEIQRLEKEGVKQITFLGQNVNSYHDTTGTEQYEHSNSQDFHEMFKLRDGPGPRFAQLLGDAASRFPEIRFRFTSPHPKDFPEEVIDVMAKYPNISKYIHMPLQSGSNSVLERMRRNYTIEAYRNLIHRIRQKIPGVTFSTDMIAGFCGQTDEQFQETINALDQFKYEIAFLYMYSMRPKTHAARNYIDDVPQQTKKKRLQQMISTFHKHQAEENLKEKGKFHLALVEQISRRDPNKWMGKTDTFKKAFFQNIKLPVLERLSEQVNTNSSQGRVRQIKRGDYVVVKVNQAYSKSLICEPLAIMSLQNYYKN